MNTIYLLASLIVFWGNGGWGGGHNINGDEIAGLGLGAAALVGVVGYLIMRRRSSKQD